jgi:hypothetical protein
MAITLYKEHLVVSTATFHSDEHRWIPAVIISWKSGKQHQFHDIKDFPQLFAGEQQQAEYFGMEVAKAWIDERL